MTDAPAKIASAWDSIRNRWDLRRDGPWRRVHVRTTLPVRRAFVEPGDMMETVPIEAVEFTLGDLKGWCDGLEVWRWRDVIGEYQGHKAVVGWMSA